MNGPSVPKASDLGARLAARIDALGALSDDPANLTRLTLSPSHKCAAGLVADWMRQAGIDVEIDPLGTVVGRIEGARPDAKTLLLGSHIDTVRNAGRYDGSFGVLAAIAAVEELRNAGVRLPFAIEVLAFGDEEGVRFGSTLTGSRAVAGCFDPEALEDRDAEGVTRREALAQFGADPDLAASVGRDPAAILGYVEVHIEQGPVLEAHSLPLGIVTAVNGAMRGEITVTGKAGHSGTLPMNMRQDALTAAAEIVLAIEDIARRGENLVATVGRIEVPDGAVNIVPGLVRLSFDIRCPSDDTRHAAFEAVRNAAAGICARRNVEASFQVSYDMPAAPCDPALLGLIERSFMRNGYAPFRLPSGAGHDAMSFRGRIPFGLIFVRCRGGVSHNPEEYASDEDMAAAVVVLKDLILMSGEKA